ncbi:hypothetical protein LTR27_006954 [Elasticomyces elasticus]|nr:hypothetical protein LTR27_006954 [Elasticomyces elasticus]
MGILTWVGEKYNEAADPEKQKRPHWTDCILTTASLYYFTDCIMPSMLCYYENVRHENFASFAMEEHNRITVPFGYTSFYWDTEPSSKRAVERTGNLVYYKERNDGGHYAALEDPEGIIQDVVATAVTDIAMTGARETTTARLSKDDQAELDALNAAVNRMREITRPDPYVLTLPQDEPKYRHQYQHQAQQWVHHTPFEWKEGERTQWQTFVYHEHGKDLFVLHAPRETKEAEGAKSKAAPGVDTPNAGPKKKISLNAYKKKQAEAGTPKALEAQAVKTLDAPVKQAAVKGPMEQAKAETEEVLAAVKDLEAVPLEEVIAPVKPDLKRKREEVVEPVKEDAQAVKPPTAAQSHEDENAVSEPATKKVRTVALPPTPAAETKAPSPIRLAEPRPKTPQAMSSTAPATSLVEELPPRLSPLRADSLPSRLSPTIPANMQATIKAREQLKASSSDHFAPVSTSKNGTLTPPRQHEMATKRKSPIPLNAFRANSSSPAVRSDAEDKRKVAATVAPPQRPKSPELSQDEEKAVGKALKTFKPADKPSSLIVKLKYKKHQRETVQRILNLRTKSSAKTTPKPTAAAAPKAVEEPKPATKSESKPEPKPERSSLRRRDPTAKGVAQKIGPPAKSKQPEMARYETPAKRKESTSTDAAKAAPAIKRKRSNEEPLVPEPPPDRSKAAVSEIKTQEPPAKRLKVPNPPRADAPHAAPPVRPALPVKRSSERSNEESKPAAKDVPAKHGNEAHAKSMPTEKSAEVPTLPTAVPRIKEPETKQSQDDGSKIEQSQSKKLGGNVPALQSKPAEKQQPSVTEPATKAKESTTTETAKQPSPLKRRKVPDAIETSKTSSTPVQPDLQSPFVPISTQKSQQVTPAMRKDHLSAVAIAREVSTDASVNTPSSGSSSTPVINNGITSQPNGGSSKTASGSQVRTAVQQAWDEEHKRLNALGRELKHAATAHLGKLKLAASDPHGPSTEQKLASVKCLESLLAYFLAFTSQEQVALAAEPKQGLSTGNWSTLHGYFAFVKHNCEATPLLHGLACHLGVVFSAHILNIVQQFYAGKQQALQDITFDAHTALIKNARDADAKLDSDALVEHFPQSWESRTRSPSASEAMTPGVFAGEFKLPMGVHTSPIRAARAGYAMLGEWIRKEGVDYELELKL